MGRRTGVTFYGVGRETLSNSHEELLEPIFQPITHSDDLENNLDNLHRMLAGEIYTYSIEKRYGKKDPSEFEAT